MPNPTLLNRVNSWFFMASGQRHAAAGEYAPAHEAYLDGLAQTPDDPGLHLHLGLCLLKMGRTDEALASINRAVEHAPDNPAFQLFLALALFDAGKTGESRAACERVIALEPENQVVYGMTILLDLREGPAAEALRLLSRQGLPANDEIAAHIVMAMEEAMLGKQVLPCP